MAVQITNYQCPACTGPLRFDGDKGKLVCDFCEAAYEIAEIERLFASKENAAAAQLAAEEKAATARASGGGEPTYEASLAGSAFSAEEAARLRAWNCPSCGAELICDETTAATSCPYCGNPTVVPGQLRGASRPDSVIPFRLDKTAAKLALKKYYRGKLLLPKSFADDNHIEEIKGVYVPFWLYDYRSEGQARYEGTTETKSTVGDTRITTIDHYEIERQGNAIFEKIPVDASTKMPDGHMDAIEPFDYADLKPFSTAYLPGFLADKYDVDASAGAQRAESRVRASTEDALRGTVGGYSSVHTEYVNVQLSPGPVSSAMMPVWMLASRWKGKNFLFAMNGQSGKLVGDLPMDLGKMFIWFGSVALGLAAILAVFLFDVSDSGISIAKILVTALVPLLMAGLTCLLLRMQLKTARKQRAAASYMPQGGFQITWRNDRFLRREERREAIQRKDAGEKK